MPNPNLPELAGQPVYCPTDVYAIVNSALAEMTGQRPQVTAVDTSSFVSVGETMLRIGMESTLRALCHQIGKTLIAIRPYRSRFSSIEADRMEYGLITQKISYFSSDFDPTTSWNTDINPDQLRDGKSVDMYSIKKQYPLQMFFTGLNTLQKDVTRFRNQLKVAFKSEADFSAFYYGLTVEVNNSIEMMKESQNRLILANHVGAVYNTGAPRSKVNLTAEFNAARGTAYTSEELRTTHLQEFLSFFVSYLKTITDLMEENCTLFHLQPAATDDSGNPLTLLRHTPKALQRLLLFQPLINDAVSWVYPAIFGPGYLSFGNYEGVNYWQNINRPASIFVTPSQFDVTTGEKVTGEPVGIDYLVGVLYDRDALAVSYMQDSVDVSPFNTRGKYWNTTYNWVRQYKDDPTENSIIFYMADQP